MNFRFLSLIIGICLSVIAMTLLFGQDISQTHAASLKDSLGSRFSDQAPTTSGTAKQETMNVTPKNIPTSLKGLFGETCQPAVFTDIGTNLFAADIQHLANLCIVRGTIKPGKFYPDNILRRTDALSMLVQAYKHYALDKNELIEPRIFRDIKSETKLATTIQAAEKMGLINLLITKKAQKLVPDAFISQSDIRRLMAYISTNYPAINTHGLGILTDDDELVTRGELAHIIAISLRKPDPDVPVKNTTPKAYPGIQLLINAGIISSTDYMATNPDAPMTRLEFLSLLVTCEHYRSPSIPLKAIGKVQYFTDLIPTMEYIFSSGTIGDITQTDITERFTDFAGVINQAKNLGLTNFFETTKRGKLYLDPTKYVSEYEATMVINQAAPTKLDVDTETDTVLITNEKVASLLAIAYNLTAAPTGTVSQKATLGELRDRVKGMF